jgi:hypothetical protein
VHGNRTLGALAALVLGLALWHGAAGEARAQSPPAPSSRCVMLPEAVPTHAAAHRRNPRLCTPTATPSPAGLTIQSTRGQAAVDGVMSPGEWDGAGRIEFVANVEGGGTTPATLLAMNDGGNLYLSVKVRRGTVGSTSLTVELDGNRTGALDHGDDGVLINPDIGFFDLVRWGEPPCPEGALCGLFDTSVGGTNDGAGAVQVNVPAVGEPFSFYELSHPLNSPDDLRDVSLAAGETIGFRMNLRFCDEGGCFDTDLPGFAFGTLMTAPAP